MSNAERYARFDLIPWWQQETLSRATVVLAGAGAVGNEVLKNLVLMGVGRVIVIDMDTVELSNLTRSVFFRAEDAAVSRRKVEAAAARAQVLNPDVEILPIHGDLVELGPAVLAGADLVLGCFDSMYGRLILNRYCAQLGIPWLNGGLGDAQDVFKANLTLYALHLDKAPCFECNKDPQMVESVLGAKLYRNSCGEIQQTAPAGSVPSTPTTASILGGLLVQEALKILHGVQPDDGGGASTENTALEPFWHRWVCYNTGSHDTFFLQLSPNENCPNHTLPSPRQLGSAFDARQPLSRLWRSTLSSPFAPDTVFVLGHGRRLVTQINCETCGDITLNRYLPEGALACPQCQGTRVQPSYETYLTPDSPVINQSLKALGFPPGTYLEYYTPEGSKRPVFWADMASEYLPEIAEEPAP